METEEEFEDFIRNGLTSEIIKNLGWAIVAEGLYAEEGKEKVRKALIEYTERKDINNAKNIG